MKKIFFSLLILIMIFPLNACANSNVTLYFFRGSTCPHCEEALNYINEHRDEIPDGIKIVTYEVYDNADNEKLHQAVAKKLNIPDNNKGSVPLLVAGDTYIVGMLPNKADFNEAMSLAKKYLEEGTEYKDLVKETVNELKKSDSSLKIKEIAFETLFKDNTIASYIVLGIFGVIIVGFIGMILFSRKK